MTNDLNNQGDYISGAVGEDGKDVIVGKGITQNDSSANVTVNLPPPPPGHYPYDHPVREYTLSDVIVALIGDPGDPLKSKPGTLGVINQLAVIVAHLSSLDALQTAAHKERLELLNDVQILKSNQISNVFRVLLFVTAIMVLVAAALFIVKGIS